MRTALKPNRNRSKRKNKIDCMRSSVISKILWSARLVAGSIYSSFCFFLFLAFSAAHMGLPPPNDIEAKRRWCCGDKKTFAICYPLRLIRPFRFRPPTSVVSLTSLVAIHKWLLTSVRSFLFHIDLANGHLHSSDTVMGGIFFSLPPFYLLWVILFDRDAATYTAIYIHV